MQRSSRLSRAEFLQELEPIRHRLWLVAVGVVRDRHLAEDVVQDASVLALNKLAGYRRGTHFAAWMSQIVRNLARNAARKHRRERPHPGADAGLDDRSVAPARGGSPVDANGRLRDDQAEFDDAVVAALGELSEAARSCLLLRTIEGLSYEDISDLLDMPAGTAMSHVHRGRARMRQLMQAKHGGKEGVKP